ncbi:MAG: hypothetical protein PHI78_03660, partial [Clostridia bacterium]|nr:hypothetical protein [Clostridia bacterium]
KGTVEEIKAETDRIAKANAEIIQRFYQANAPQGGAEGANPNGANSANGADEASYDVKDADNN